MNSLLNASRDFYRRINPFGAGQLIRRFLRLPHDGIRASNLGAFHFSNARVDKIYWGLVSIEQMG